MRKRLFRLEALALALLMAILCAGCMVSSVEELYSLPEMSEEYEQLRALVAQRVDAGSVYAAPIGGSNRQSVQLQDLDGDGVEEALAFLADENNTPTVCVYRQNEDGDYYLYVIISGDGSAVASVEYADLNGDGAAELIIAWQISGDIRLLSVYALGSADQAEQAQLLSADCTDFLVCDLDGDGKEDLLDLRIDYGGQSTLVMYCLDGDNAVSSTFASLSSGITRMHRAVSGTLSDGAAALFVESELGSSGIVTDVFTASGGQVRNLTMTGMGYSGTLRPEPIFAMDINGDHCLELPQGEGEIWYWYGLNSAGEQTLSATTCYNRTDGWYLLLQGPLLDGLSLERYGSGGDEPAVVFTVAGDGSAPPRSVLVIYAVTGQNRMERATVDDRFILLQEEDTIYAAQLLTDELTREDIINNFYLIYEEWQTGDL